MGTPAQDPPAVKTKSETSTTSGLVFLITLAVTLAATFAVIDWDGKTLKAVAFNVLVPLLFAGVTQAIINAREK